MQKSKSIPVQDLKDINEAFSNDSKSQVILKNKKGEIIKKGVVKVNDKRFIFKDFRGKSLKHDKIVIPVGGKQTVVGIRGQVYESIPEEKRLMVTWFDSDFE